MSENLGSINGISYLHSYFPKPEPFFFTRLLAKFQTHNVAAFDGMHRALVSGSKAHGHNGPGPTPQVVSTSSDVTNALLATILTGLTRKRTRSPEYDFCTPARKQARPMPFLSPIESPVPKWDEILHTCLLDMVTQLCIDLTTAETFL